MPFTNPGQAFIDLQGQIAEVDDVLRYAAYLRDQAGLTSAPPVDLHRIYSHFGIPLPIRRPLPDLQGILVNPHTGVIIVNSDDVPMRQRFTEAHELMEMLFACLKPGTGWAARRRVGPFRLQTKEKLCDAGAAELLMPNDSFGMSVRRLGVGYHAARQLAAFYQVSTTAALVQMVRLGPGCHAVVLWRMKNKPSEKRDALGAGQLPLLGMPERAPAAPKLRVEWAITGPGAPYIPKDKSVPADCSVHMAWESGTFTQGEDCLELGGKMGVFGCESQPFEVEGERCVLSLLHMPGDASCSPSDQ
jgi:hypothetical protein